jgi:hypothetical protein
MTKWSANPEESLPMVTPVQSGILSRTREAGALWRLLIFLRAFSFGVPLARGRCDPQQKGYEKDHPMPLLRRAGAVHADD